MEFRYTKTVEASFRDCDPLGHVNNAVYLTYFEVARFAYCRDALGFTPGRALANESFIMARVECNFRSQAMLGTVLDVRIRVSEIGRSSFAFEYEIVDAADGRLVAEGRSVQVMFDYVGQQKILVPEDFRARIEAFERRTFPRPAAQPVG